MTTIDIAGWRVQLDCEPANLVRAAAARYANFAASGSPDLIARVIWENHAANGSIRFDNLPTVSALDEENGFQLDGPGFSGTINADLTTASFVITGIDPLSAVEYFARVAYALLAYRRGGLLLHAAGLLVEKDCEGDGQVHLFIGQSGSGKSTVVRLSPHARVLNDDLILLRPTDGGWIACGTPFWNKETGGRQDEAARGPVAGVYKLIQDADIYVEPLTGALAVAELVANCPVVNSIPMLLPGVLARCRQLARERPIYRLHFRQTPDFWNVLLG